ncbi:MAG: hypothetical protein JST82_12375 [Bacteroidetes bacterium]|nr:hypothetical protein [Bacteroidota bacterium]
MKQLIVLICLVIVSQYASAQNNLSFDSLNKTRVKTNKIGMLHLGGWGTINVIAGGIGYFTANDKEWKSFHGMNAIWGATNALIAFGGFSGAKKEAGQLLSCDKALARYESNKRLFLINAGLDVLYIGTGVTLNAYADNFNDPAMWHGFGKSIALQGIALLIFDGTMYTLHSRHNKQWYKLLQGVCVTGNGVGLNYNF